MPLGQNVRIQRDPFCGDADFVPVSAAFPADSEVFAYAAAVCAKANAGRARRSAAPSRAASE
jgi:hypothetical protein